MKTRRCLNRKWWLVYGLLAAGIVIVGGYYLTRGFSPTPAHANESGTEQEEEPQTPGVRVQVVRPRKISMDRTTKWLPCEVHSYGWAPLFAEVSGKLHEQELHGKPVDIGTKVKKGDILAKIEVPELEQQWQRNKALVTAAEARVAQMDARVTTAEAERDAAAAGVIQATANAKSAEAWRLFRAIQLGRMQDLAALKTIDDRLVDESKKNYTAAEETKNTADAAIATAKAHFKAAEAKILQARADVAEADAQVRVAEAERDRSAVMVGFAIIRSPYNGIVTQRSLLPGGFVRTGNVANNIPLLTVEETDKMRVVVQVPDRDVRYVDEGKDTAIVEIDAFPGEKFTGIVSRKGGCEDPQTRLMRVEIDVDNKESSPSKGKILRGMFGRVNIILEKSAEVLTVPPSCVASRTPDGKGTVWVLRDNCARRLPVLIGEDNGVRIAILQGLKATDQVIRRPPADLTEGATVAISSSDAPGGRPGR